MKAPNVSDVPKRLGEAVLSVFLDTEEIRSAMCQRCASWFSYRKKQTPLPPKYCRQCLKRKL